MSRLKELVSSPDCRAARAFELAIQTVIVMSLLAFSLETLQDLPDWGREILSWVEVATVLIFTAEYLLRLLAAEKKSTFVFSFFGIIDLVAILPLSNAGWWPVPSSRPSIDSDHSSAANISCS